ncbi:MAG TPA: gluconeogenesis factor YvcK family protein [Candidatus Eisenbacteria bacterium]|nr:gluconeogenesis factor YvcK family protein [Candidatus Eisenbacteria bacterium]
MNILLIGGRTLQRDLSLLLSRLRVRLEVETDEDGLRRRLQKGFSGVILFDHDDFVDNARRDAFYRQLKSSKCRFLVISSARTTEAILAAARRGSADYILRPCSQREFIMRLNAVAQGKKRIACIGGGTGLFTLLLGLKTLPNALSISIVNMSDDGGSSGKLSQAFGILPPGDIRRSLVALSNAPELMNQIIQHRFDKGGELHGHSFGNIFLTVLAEVKGSMAEAVKALADILNIQGIVLPATKTLTTLVARFQNGLVVKGESRIDRGDGRPPELRIKKLSHEPESECEPEAFSSIIHAEAVIIGPGDLFTSVVTNLVVRDIRDAIVRTKAKKIYVCNLMTKPGETAGFDAAAHVREIVRYLGEDCLDYVLVSNSALSRESILEYAKKNQSPVAAGRMSSLRAVTRAKIVIADLGDETELVRHDSMKLREEIRKILKGL